MPEGSTKSEIGPSLQQNCGLRDLSVGKPDSIGATVRDILFRGSTYAIYRSDRGVYVHFSDDEDVEQAQRQAYTLLAGQICELRYLSCEMSASVLNRIPLLSRFVRRRDSLYEHNMAQALMLLMESSAQRTAKKDDAATATEKRAKEIADRALDMAVRRVTIDNTIRYVTTCVIFGVVWVAALLPFCFPAVTDYRGRLILASIMGTVGAVFSVIVRAQAFELKPCDDSRLNKLMGTIRVGMGGIAGPTLLLLFATVFAETQLGHNYNSTANLASEIVPIVAIIGLVGGFAERLVPNLVRSTIDKVEFRAGTPVQATNP